MIDPEFKKSHFRFKSISFHTSRILKSYFFSCLLVQTEVAFSSSSSFFDNFLTNSPPGKIPASPRPNRGSPVLGNSLIVVGT